MEDLSKEIAAIEKQYGKGCIIKLTSDNIQSVERIPTGIPSIDEIIGGGLARGRISEFFGSESSGKSTLAIHCIVEAQKLGHNCVYIDAEHAIDLEYIQKIGIDIDKLYFVQPDCGEQALGIAEACCETGKFGIIVIDSVAALTPKAEIDGEYGESHMGLQARLLNQAMRKLSAVTDKTKTILIFINQLRVNLGVIYGSKDITTGGNGLKYYASLRLNMKKLSAKIINGEDIIGYEVSIHCTKNKTAPPFKKVTVPLVYGVGFDAKRSLFDMCLAKDIIILKGAWYTMGEAKHQGKENFLENVTLEEMQEVYNESN